MAQSSGSFQCGNRQIEYPVERRADAVAVRAGGRQLEELLGTAGRGRRGPGGEPRNGRHVF